MQLDLNDTATRTQFPALARIYDTIHAAFVTAGSPALAAACIPAINALTMASNTRNDVLNLCARYGERAGGSELASAIINGVLYETWDNLKAQYNLPSHPAGEGPDEISWAARVMLIELIAEAAREIVLEHACGRLALLSDGDTSTVEAAVRDLSVSAWGTLPTAEEIEAWRAAQ